MSRHEGTSEPILFWSGKVLTLDGLRSHWGRLQEVVIGPRTVVSPLVVDELRARKIVLRRGEPTSLPSGGRKSPGSSALGIAQQDSAGVVNAALASLDREGIVLTPWQPKGASLPAWAWSLGLLVKQGQPPRGVALVQDAALVCCVAGKVTGVRAAAVASVPQASRALTTMSANLLAVETPGRTLFELKQILRAAATTRAEVSEDLNQVLKELDGHAHR